MNNHLSSSDLKFGAIVAVIVCPTTFFAVLTFGAIGALAIMLIPIAFIIRSPKHPSEKNTEQDSAGQPATRTESK